jgi:putative acetyltransferase
VSAGLTITPADPASPEVSGLLTASDAYQARLYPPQSIYTISAEEAADPDTVFLLATTDGKPAGCGALVPGDLNTAEIKRMFVAESARGAGVGRAILAALEKAAQKIGIAVIRLETGPRSPEAIALYESAGYRRIPNYGEYVGDEFSVCYEKQLN